jgi:hypothetical protein
MSNMKAQSVCNPDRQLPFNEWVKELNVSKTYTEDKIIQMVLEDENRRMESMKYLEGRENPQEVQPTLRIRLAQVIKNFKEKYGTN